MSVQLPVKDYPLEPLGPEELDERGAQLVEHFKAMTPGMTGSARELRKFIRQRSFVAYGAVLLRAAALWCRENGAETYADLTDEQQLEVTQIADGVMRRVVAGDPQAIDDIDI